MRGRTDSGAQCVVGSAGNIGAADADADVDCVMSRLLVKGRACIKHVARQTLPRAAPADLRVISACFVQSAPKYAGRFASSEARCPEAESHILPAKHGAR